MDDSDEYFDDTFVLDEEVLASIQATEERFGASLSQAHTTSSHRLQPSQRILRTPSSPPSAKRLKTSHGWLESPAYCVVPRVPPKPALRKEECTDLIPDIRLGSDGSYIMSGQPETSHGTAAIQKSLQEAQEALLIRTGEVSILRQTIEKTQKEYAEAVAKAKADLIMHEKVKADLQAKLNEETERTATRLIFNQHEMETSSRKPSWGSVRSRRVAKDLALSSSAVANTPTRAHGHFPPPLTKRTTRQALPTHDPDRNEGEGPLSSPLSARKAKQSNEGVKQPTFKGFHNAFTDSRPVGAAQNHVKGKIREFEAVDTNDLFFAPVAVNEVEGVEMHEAGKNKRKEREMVEASEETEVARQGTRYEESIMDIDEIRGVEISMDSDQKIEQEGMMDRGVDWGEELRRIVFTHVAPRSNTLTLHVLFSTILPSGTTPQERHAYATACQVILESCGAAHGNVQYPADSERETEIVDKVASAFVTVSGVLSNAACIEPLVALLDLLMLLVLYIPAFIPPFLGPVAADEDLDGPSQLLSVLCDVVENHLPHVKLDSAEATKNMEKLGCTLSMAVVQLMESLCWNAKDGLVDRLRSIPLQRRILKTLLDLGRNPELIARVLQLLILLTTHKGMSPFVFNFIQVDAVAQAPVFVLKEDWSRVSFVEKLCSYLTEPAFEKSLRIQYLVVTLIHLISEAHVDARTILLESVCLAPSLVICITKLSRALWEDDLAVLNMPELAKLTVDMLFLSVNLLHHLVFALELSLGRKLVEATRLPGASFNGVTHMFIVTFGRLSWAEGPEWLDNDCKDMCAVITGQAMEIIETVVSGPECDSLWAVWHQHDHDIIDDDEAEAQKIDME